MEQAPIRLFYANVTGIVYFSDSESERAYSKMASDAQISSRYKRL
jgi:hypothetical protein